MPEPGNAPPELQDLLDKVYKSARKEPGYDKGAASGTAWKAAKSAGWYKKSGKWTKKNETDSSYWNWNNFWKQAEYAYPQNLRESMVTALGTVKVQESLVPFKARILLAVPGTSLNNREYPKETLEQCAPLYVGRPFILDHNIEDANKVIGLFTSSDYTIERSPFTKQSHEGLWGTAIGLMEQDLFDKIKGTPLIPPLVRNVSIGGQGDGDYNVNGHTLIKNFIPAEGSITAFPGIPTAHIASIEAIREHYLGQGGKNTSMNDVRASLETRYGIRKKNPNEKEKPPVGGGRVFHETPPAEKLMEIRERETREGPWMPSIPPNRPDLRGATAEPDSQQYRYDWTTPQATTSRDAGYMPDPAVNTGDWDAGRQQNISSVMGFDPTSKNQTYGPTKYSKFMKGYSSTEDAPGTAGSPGSRDAKAWTSKQKVPGLGRTTTKAPGFGKAGPSGTGMPQDDDESRERSFKAALADSLNRDLSRVLYKMRTGQEAVMTTQKPGEEEEEEGEEEAKIDVSKPEEEEEEEIMQALVTIEQNRVTRELQADLGDQTNPWPNIGRSSMPTGYDRTYYRGRGINATHMPPNQYDPRPLYSAGKKKGAYARSSEAKKGEEEEEEEERQNLMNRLLAIRLHRLSREAVPGAEPRANAPIPKTPKLGYSTTKKGKWGTGTPSGTGITDQDEEEEAVTINVNGIRYRKEQEAGSDVDKTDKPEGEEEEEERATVTISDDDIPKIADEEESRMPSDLLKRPEDFTQANPIRSGGEEEERRVIIPDLTPDDFHAPAMPYGTGIEKLWNQIHPDPRMDTKKVGEMVELWRRFKTPPAQKPPQVYAQLPKEQKGQKMKESQGSPIQSSEMNTVPWLGVQAKGMAPIYPTYTGPATSSGTRSIMDEAKQVIENISKKPMAPGRMTTAMAHEAYMEMLANGRILGIRR